MISKIRLKFPLWIVDPDKMHATLCQVEAYHGGAWEMDCHKIDQGWRIYGFGRVVYHESASK